MKDQRNFVVSVFGSSRPGPNDLEYKIAYEVGRKLATVGITVCNGGYGGIMEASARGAKEAGGHTIGVICSSFGSRHANRWTDEVIVEETLLNRLATLVSNADGYVVLKGGTGTLLELAAVWEFMNKNIIREKPFIAVGTFWTGVIDTLKEELKWEGMEQGARMISVVASPDECVEVLTRAFGIKP